MEPRARPAGRGGLSLERIVDAAVDLARRDGIDALSMRRVAVDLGVESMSLYHYVPSKASLVMLMADRTLSQMSVPDPTRAWHEQLVDLLVQTYNAATNNPALLPVLASEPLHPGTLPAARGTGGPSLALLERVLQLLQQGRVPADLQVDSFRGLIGLTIGFVAGQVDGMLPKPAAGDQPDAADRRQRAGTAPLLTAISPALSSADPARSLRFALEVYVAGLGQLARQDDGR